jgi:oligopeptide/dipeptide ABC transporter ATP-binding protein
VFTNARHPYTQGLLRAVPKLVPGRASEAAAIVGDPPSPIRLPSGCRFHPRCPIAQPPVCVDVDPRLESGPGAPDHAAACHFAWTTRPAEHVPEVAAQ